MRFWVLHLLCLVGLCGCLERRDLVKGSQDGAQPTGVWKAFLANGDKPGIGIELRFAKRGVSGIYYMMDPNDPGNFRKGRKATMQTLQADCQHLIFAVCLPGIGSREIHIRFDAPFLGDHVDGMLGREASLAIPLKFKRQKSQ